MTRPLTAARATGLAREALNGAVLFTTQTGNDCLLTRVRTGAITSADELRALNTAAAYFRRFGYEATVITSGGTRGAAVRRTVKVVDLAARAARIEQATAARAAALATAAAESPAATPAELAYDGGRTAQVAAELAAPAERITCGLCGEPLVRETPADSGSFWRHENPALDGHPQTTVETWGPDPVAVTREHDAAPARVLTADGEVHTAAPGPTGPTTSCGLTAPVLVTELPLTCEECAPARRGPSREVVAAAVARFQAELDANADAIGAVLSEPLPGEDSTAQCPACRYYTGHTSWCPLRG